MHKQLSLMASLLVTLFIFVSDQCTKLWMDAHFELYESVKIINGFNLTLTHNTGMAFSLFSQGYFWQFLFLTIFPILIMFAIILWIYRICDKKKHLELFALSLILGGAFGNLLDRLRLGHVIDFIHVYWQNYHWPVFNIADSAITVGTVLLMWCLLKSGDEI